LLADYQRHDNLPIIQVLIFIRESLAEYYQKVKGKKYDLVEILDLELDLRERCPLCGGKDCAGFIGYYTRVVIDEHGTYFKGFPIARYVCKGKRSRSGHKTFSLLPYQLVPYTRYSIPFIIKSLKARYEEGLSIIELQDYLAGFGEDDILSLSADQIINFKKIVLEAVHKITATGHYPELAQEVLSESTDQQIVVVFIGFALSFECSKVEPSIRGPCGLGYDFYLNEGGFAEGAHFLFGTPSQFR